MYPSPTERFEDFINHRPESKLELIEGQLIVGNSLTGSRLLLRQILQGWGAEAAIALAPIETWIEALTASYDLSLPNTNALDEKLDGLEAQVSAIEFCPEDLLAGCAEETWSHHQIRQNLTMSLFQLAEQVGGRSLGRDFVMRLGDNGFTPDVVFFKSEELNQLYASFVSGPAELVIEILLPGHEDADRFVKRSYYQAANVPEYWLICRWVDGQYQRQQLESDGYYRPSSVPRLAFRVDALWRIDDYNPLEQSLFVVEQRVDGFERPQREEGPKWGALLFIPNIQVDATPICFEEYMSWCPEAKFEFINGKPLIGSTPGTRNVLALLLMTFGLTSTVKLLPPQAWIQSLRQRLDWERHDAERKAEWWEIAHQAAERLRSHFSIERLGVIGELAGPQPLNYWSDITLVYWEAFADSWRIYDVLRDIDPDLRINLIRAGTTWLTADEQFQIEHQLVEI